MSIFNPSSVTIIYSKGLEDDLYMHGLPAYGTFQDVFNLNDGNPAVADICWANAVGQYAIVELPSIFTLNAFRYHQHNRAGQNGDAEIRIQYWDEATLAWVDWITGVTILCGVDQWEAWNTTPPEIQTRMIRVEATALDSGGIARCEFNEFQVRGT